MAGFVFQANVKRSAVATEPTSAPPLEAAAAVEDSQHAPPPPPPPPARACAAVRLESLELMVGTEMAAPAGLKVLFPMPWEAQSAAHSKAKAEVTVESEIAIATRLHVEGSSPSAGLNASVSGNRHSSSDGAGGAGGAAGALDSKGGAKGSSSPPSLTSPLSSSYNMTQRFTSSAASAVGSGFSSLRRKQNSSSPPLPPAAPPTAAAPLPASIGAVAVAGNSESSQGAPETMDVAWLCKPSATGKWETSYRERYFTAFINSLYEGSGIRTNRCSHLLSPPFFFSVLR